MSREFRCAFGPFLLDTRSGEMHRGDIRISLMPKVFQLLAYLVENRGRLITREELMEAIWADTHVTESSLSRAMSNLRDVLGDNTADPRFIETLPRRGYKFIADVREQPLLPLASDSRFSLVYNGRVYPLRFGENILGRAEDSIVPIDSPAVSRHHTAITVSGEEAILNDLGSKNGTFLGGQRLERPTQLRDRDEIKIGPATIAFRARPVNASTVTDVAG